MRKKNITEVFFFNDRCVNPKQQRGINIISTSEGKVRKMIK